MRSSGDSRGGGRLQRACRCAVRRHLSNARCPTLKASCRLTASAMKVRADANGAPPESRRVGSASPGRAGQIARRLRGTRPSYSTNVDHRAGAAAHRSGAAALPTNANAPFVDDPELAGRLFDSSETNAREDEAEHGVEALVCRAKNPDASITPGWIGPDVGEIQVQRHQDPVFCDGCLTGPPSHRRRRAFRTTPSRHRDPDRAARARPGEEGSRRA